MPEGKKRGAKPRYGVALIVTGYQFHPDQILYLAKIAKRSRVVVGKRKVRASSSDILRDLIWRRMKADGELVPKERPVVLTPRRTTRKPGPVQSRANKG